MLVVATSAAGYYLGASGPLNLSHMAAAVAGTTLVAGGAAALNQVYERDTDALMRRTRMRPLPDGRVSAFDARMFGLLLSAAGLVLLGLLVNLPATALALTTLVVYLIVYTPMKRRSSLATLVGAVPGALPPLIGWAASHGGLSTGGAALFLIVFLWQIPHFMAIAWLYRDDYGKAGFPMLPVIEPDGRRTGRQAVAYAAALVPASLVPTAIGLSGAVYAAFAIVLGAALAVAGHPLRRHAKRSLGPLAVLLVDHLSADPLDRHDGRQAVTVHSLPAVNATLNAISTVLLVTGYLLIRRRQVARHRRVMLAACVTSTLFLISYLTYHAQVGSVRFERQGFVRPLYFTILITHVTLAALVLPLAIVTLSRGLRERFDRHRAIARWTLPIWLYVSVTGVLVYVLLYQPTWLI